MFGIALALVALLPAQPQASASPFPSDLLTIAVDEPVYTGQPVWVRVENDSRERVRFPFGPALADIGCNRLEVMRDGVLLTPLPLRGEMSWIGPPCGSGAPRGSPAHRLPLHILYPFKTAGTYSVRLAQLGSGPPGPNGERSPEAISRWLTFTVLEATPEQHETWLKNLLAMRHRMRGCSLGTFFLR
jgi:hypothetical protein